MNAELATALSDAPLALLASGLAWHLWSRRAGHPVARPMAAFLAATGIAAALGGTWHAARELVSPEVSDAWWSATIVTLGLADVALLIAATTPLSTGPRGFFRSFAWAKFAALIGFSFRGSSFLPAALDQGVTLAAVLGLAAWDRRTQRGLRFAPTVASAVTALLAGVCQVGRLDLTPVLNHNVLYHLLALVALAGFWRSASASRSGTAGVREKMTGT